jgi:hypothetical protein
MDMDYGLSTTVSDKINSLISFTTLFKYCGGKAENVIFITCILLTMYS